MDRETSRLSDRRAAYASELEPPTAAEDPTANDWVSRIGEPVLPQSDRLSPSEVKIEPATLADPEYAGPDPVPVRRLVYRVTLVVPDALTAQRPLLKVPSGELHLDVGEQRVRARFVGPGWPVDDGSEVRLRSDVPGVYVFDGDGGRPMGPGALGGWFQGQAGVRSRTAIELRHDLGPPDEGPGNLLCAFMAEWSQAPRDEIMPQCTGSIPPGFRFGPWSGELTALVPMVLPRSQLRADAVALPSPLATANARPLLDKGDLTRVPPSPVSAASPERAAASGESIRIINRSTTRVAVIVQGVPVAWVKPQARGNLGGLAPGQYRVAGMRPNGQLVGLPLAVQLPARLTFGQKELDAAQLRAPFSDPRPEAR